MMSGSEASEGATDGCSKTKKYAVIFTADVERFDEQYSEMAIKMRNLAIKEYGCLDFIAVTEGDKEIALSYWQNLTDIKRWKQNAEHLVAQSFGKEKWYRSYTVEVVELIRGYSSK